MLDFLVLVLLLGNFLPGLVAFGLGSQHGAAQVLVLLQVGLEQEILAAGIAVERLAVCNMANIKMKSSIL